MFIFLCIFRLHEHADILYNYTTLCMGTLELASLRHAKIDTSVPKKKVLKNVKRDICTCIVASNISLKNKIK